MEISVRWDDFNENLYIISKKLVVIVFVIATAFVLLFAIPAKYERKNAIAVITETWQNLPAKWAGYEPCFQRVEYTDGTVASGPLFDGLRHGRWRVESKGNIRVFTLRLGKIESEAPSEINFANMK